MKIAVVGTGYVGLVTGTCFAETGNKVTCVDIDKNKVEKLSGGQITIYEPGLEKIFLRNIKESRLQFTTQLEEAVEDAAALIIATEWSGFRTPDFERMENEIKHKIIFDGRNLFDVKRMPELGYNYFSIGRAESNKA